MTEQERFEAAERQLAQVQSFFPRVDSRTSTLFAVASGQLAVLALNVTKQSVTIWWSGVPLIAAVLMIAVAIAFLYRSNFPALQGGHNSLVYFNEIGKHTEAGFITEWKAASRAALIDDYLGQVWRNSEIVGIKFAHLRRAAILIACSLLPWTAFLAAASFQSSKMIVIPT